MALVTHTHGRLRARRYVAREGLLSKKDLKALHTRKTLLPIGNSLVESDRESDIVIEEDNQTV